MPKINFANVKEFTPLPADSYRATLSAAKYMTQPAGSDKADYVNLEFTVNDGGEFDGRKIFRNAALSEKTLWAFKRDMIALGTDPELFDGELDPEEVATDNIGNDCIIDVIEKPHYLDPSKTTNEVTAVKDATFA